MKKNLILMLALVLMSTITDAKNPKWASKAFKSIFKLTTFRADGTLLSSSNGFFIGEDGVCLSNFAPFRGASKAVIIDATGKKYDVTGMLGANDIYDVAKFRINAKKTEPLTISSTTSEVGGDVWLLPYSVKKEVDCISGKVSKAEKFKDNYSYYTFSLSAPGNAVSCPFFNDNGEVIGLMQQPAKMKDTLSYAICAQYGADLTLTGLSINDQTLRSTDIKTELPDKQDQALVFLYMAASAADSAKYTQIVNDFIQKFPKSADGYVYRAQNETNMNDFSAAEKDMDTAIKNADKKDDVHYSYSKLIFQKEITKTDKPYTNWSLDKAIDEAQKAYSINPLPIYKHQQAQIMFAQKKYQDAYNTYIELTKTNLRSAQVFFAAAKCKEMMKADSVEVLAMLDSAVNCFQKPYLKEAAPYILARAQYKASMKKFRDAVSDYNEYENLMIADVNDNFYYIREQAELQGHLFQQALNDIAKAITMNSKNPVYYAEQSSIQLRVSMIDEAIESAKSCIKIAPDYSDGYLFLGLAQIEKGNKAIGIKNLQKAKELGDAQAESLIQKYSK
jgi:tetratricopeptide (TPR) repeat protein